MGTGTTLDHRRCAEECVAMAKRAGADSDKVLWLTLAQSWVRLAEHVALVQEHAAQLPQDSEGA